MAVPTPREVVLENHARGRGGACQRASRVSLEALWHGSARGIIRRPLGERVVNFLLNSGGSESGVSQYSRFFNPASYLKVEFRRLVHHKSWKSKKRTGRQRYEASVSVH